MSYDLLVKNGRVVDGSGMPSFRGDVGVRDGKVAEIGKLSAPATKIVDAQGLVIAPGFVDNHCHFDAQVTWDPLCSFACYHGATTVIIGNCSLGLAPVRPGAWKKLAGIMSYVEAIPMNVLETIDFSWESYPQYMDTIGQRLGLNVGCLVGHTPIRYYVMGEECQGRPATEDEIEAMRSAVWLRTPLPVAPLGSRSPRRLYRWTPKAKRYRLPGLLKRRSSPWGTSSGRWAQA